MKIKIGTVNAEQVTTADGIPIQPCALVRPHAGHDYPTDDEWRGAPAWHCPGIPDPGRVAAEPTPVIIDPHDEAPIYLQPDVRVRFVLGDGPRDYVDVTLTQSSVRGTYVEVSTDTALAVEPQSANRARIRIAH